LDQTVAIWLRNSEPNRALIAKYDLTQEKLAAQVQNMSGLNFIDWVYLGNFFDTVGFGDLAARAFERAAQTYPQSRQVWLILGTHYLAQGAVDKAKDY